MRTSFNALFNRTTTGQFFTTVGLLAGTVYTGIAFKDIAVIKLIKGATLGVSIMFIFPSLFFIKLSQGSTKIQCGSPETTQRMRLLCFVIMVTGCVQGVLALLVHYKVI